LATPRPLLETPGAAFWDRALFSILAGDQGDLTTSRRLALQGHVPPGSTEAIFRRSWQAAYDLGTVPTPGEIDQLREPLGGGFAYSRLRARLAGRASQDPEPFRAQARAWALPRLVALGLGGFAALSLGFLGLVAGATLLLTRKGPHPPAPLSAFAMPGRALLLALLGWFVALRFSGTVAVLCLSILPFPKAMALPIAYGFHVCVGTALLLRAEGLTLREAWCRATPGPLPRALGWAVAFLGIAVASVFLVGILASPLVRGSEPPQRELLELVAGFQNPLTVLLLLLTIAGLAPLFEEWVFRGVILPWLGPRLAARLGERRGWGLAIILSGLAFGAMHLQPVGLPTLATLGWVLGWAFFRTGNLWTAVAVHACWNASVFLFVRVLA
jgi:membrane protease YdiL (CAAX protease family)